MAELNLRRQREGASEVRYGIGLHVGNVMFGNVGLSDRLTFSAFGSAVNEVQRLQLLTKKYPHQLIASEEFASYCGGDGWVTLGREKLAGVRQKLTVLAPNLADGAVVDDDTGVGEAHDRMSDAEQVMILHRDKSRLQLSVPSEQELL
jgi:adenylate cyclase